jgi:hypothetical protein
VTIMTYPFRTIIGMLAGVVLLASATAFAQSADKSPCSSSPRLLLAMWAAGSITCRTWQ